MKSNGSLEIRGARAKDAPFLSGLLHELGFPSSAREITARMKAMRGSVLVAVSDGEVVGFVTTSIMPVLHRPTAIGRLSALVVSKRVRGKGIGRALVTAAEKLLQERGCELAEVTSNLRLTDAHSFYRRLGYEKTSLRFKKPLNAAHDAPIKEISAF
jgi:ribosomal protein S18 acetylase RimI-like enzyme